MDWLYLALITLLAACVQSATGFGFGLIAVPVFLWVLNNASAIQVVMIVILAMALLDWFKLRGHSSRTLLRWLIIGMCAGIPLGVWIFRLVDITALKVMTAIVILGFSLINFHRLARTEIKTREELSDIPRWHTAVVGSISGMMTAILAMPGPAVMLYLIHHALEKNLIRATILTFFIFAYGGALISQHIAVGIAMETWTTGLSLVPVGLLGVLAGHAVSPKINQLLFKRIVLSTLVIMSLLMIYQVGFL